MFRYNSDTGQMLNAVGAHIGTGYSGTGEGRNNPAMENVQGVGPIPRGMYRIGAARHSDRLGPIVMNLDPMLGTNVFGRSLFRIHGNNAANDASHGCIILDHHIREEVAAYDDKELEVV